MQRERENEGDKERSTKRGNGIERGAERERERERTKGIKRGAQREGTG